MIDLKIKTDTENIVLYQKQNGSNSYLYNAVNKNNDKSPHHRWGYFTVDNLLLLQCIEISTEIDPAPF